jgi:hypothetical protein
MSEEGKQKWELSNSFRTEMAIINCSELGKRLHDLIKGDIGNKPDKDFASCEENSYYFTKERKEKASEKESYFLGNEKFVHVIPQRSLESKEEINNK